MAKSDARMAAIGDVDEANSAIGVAIAALLASPSSVRPEPVEGLPSSTGPKEKGSASTDSARTEEMGAALRRIQNDLFDLGADLATPGEVPGALRITPAQVTWLEDQIDALNAGLAPLTSFILPGGSAAAAQIHLARAIVRRAERSVVAMGGASGGEVRAYLNRLSDYLFVLARAANLSAGGDVLWVPGAGR